MKRFFCGTVLTLVCLFGTLTFAQAPATAPKLTGDEHSAIRDAQHKLDAITSQQKDLALSFQAAQMKVQAESGRLEKEREKAQADLDAATAKATAGIDVKAWKLDSETLTFTAVPAPAVPTDASTQPKSSPNASPGTAAPPKIQEAKK